MSADGINQRLAGLEALRGEHIDAYRAALERGDDEAAEKYRGKAEAVRQAIRDIRGRALAARCGLEWGRARICR